MARQYAEGTVVSVEKSRAEIETLLLKYGADQLMNAVDTASGEYAHEIVVAERPQPERDRAVAYRLHAERIRRAQPRVFDPLARPLLPEDPEWPAPKHERAVWILLRRIPMPQRVVCVMVACREPITMHGYGVVVDAVDLWLSTGQEPRRDTDDWIPRPVTHGEFAGRLYHMARMATVATMDVDKHEANCAGAATADALHHAGQTEVSWLRRWWSDCRRALAFADAMTAEIEDASAPRSHAMPLERCGCHDGKAWKADCIWCHGRGVVLIDPICTCGGARHRRFVTQEHTSITPVAVDARPSRGYWVRIGNRVVYAEYATSYSVAGGQPDVHRPAARARRRRCARDRAARTVARAGRAVDR